MSLGSQTCFSRWIINALVLIMPLGLIQVCGCKKESQKAETPEAVSAPANPANSPPALQPVKPDDPAAAQQRARMAVVMAMRRGDAPPPPAAMKLRGRELATPEVLQAYNQELLRVRVQERSSPENLEDLVQKWIGKWRLLPPLPTPPPGKRIVYDDLNGIIRLDPP